MMIRYEAYRAGLEAKFLQIDEVRYMEDLQALGLSWISLGLDTVLYDVEKKTIYTPNTNQTVSLEEGFSPAGEGSEGGEKRAGNNYIQLDNGKMNGSEPGGGADGGDSGGQKAEGSDKINSTKKLDGDSEKELNSTIEKLQEEGLVNKNIGTVSSLIPAKIEAVDPHAEKRLSERNITKEDAQSYINNSMIMFNQGNGKRRLYVSGDGNSAVEIEGNILKSAYPESHFDDGMKRIIKEAKKYVG